MQIFLVWGHCYYHSKQCYVIFTNAYFCDVERLGQYYFKKTLRPPSKFLCCCLKNLDGIHVTHSHSSLKQNNKMLMLQRWCHKSFVYCMVLTWGIYIAWPDLVFQKSWYKRDIDLRILWLCTQGSEHVCVCYIKLCYTWTIVSYAWFITIS